MADRIVWAEGVPTDTTGRFSAEDLAELLARDREMWGRDRGTDALAWLNEAPS